MCNLRCRYCFYANVSSLREISSYGKMKQEVVDKLIQQIFMDLKDNDQITFTFQGGEPTLAGLIYYQHFIEFVQQQTKQVKVHYALQTNGVLINKQWCKFLKEHDFLVGLSIDGHPQFHNQNRLDAKGKGTFERVLQAKMLFDVYRIEYNVLCVLTNQLATHAEEVVHFIKRENIHYIQFIPCLDELKEEKNNDYVLTPKKFFTFYRDFFQLWWTELVKGNYIRVKLFEDVIHLLVNQQVTACGILGNCQVQYVIEADGGVYSCDFYVLDEYRLGYIQEQTLKEIFESPPLKKFLCPKKQPLKKCEQCVFQQMCGGGCKRMKEVMYVDKNNFCGYQAFLSLFIPKISEILRYIEGADQC